MRAPSDRIDPRELRVGQCREAAGRVEDVAGRSPSDDERVASFEGLPHGNAAVDRHRVDLGGSLVRGGERDRLSVWRDRGPRLLGRMRRQALGDAAVDADAPQIALGREHDRVAVDGREAVIAERRGLGRRMRMGERDRTKKGRGEAERKMFVHRLGILAQAVGAVKTVQYQPPWLTARAAVARGFSRASDPNREFDATRSQPVYCAAIVTMSTTHMTADPKADEANPQAGGVCDRRVAEQAQHSSNTRRPLQGRRVFF